MHGQQNDKKKLVIHFSNILQDTLIMVKSAIESYLWLVIWNKIHFSKFYSFVFHILQWKLYLSRLKDTAKFRVAQSA